MSQEFSPIQNHILTRLKNAKSLRYSEIMPEKIANDLYNYHLQFLVKKGFVLKQDDGYALSDSGVKHVADPHLEDDALKIASLFKVNVITIVSRVVDGKIEILNQIRKSHPSYGKIGVMGGIVRKGELTTDAARRKLKTETGLDATFRVLGVERRLIYVKDKLFSDVFFPIAYADKSTGTLKVDTEFGHNMWVSIDEAIKNDSGEFDSIWNIVPVLRAIKAGEIDKMPYFYDEAIQSGEKMLL
ncbi:NUDIX hydrolase [Patescibacteria group bacterium]|nr:MAG: NUDIX hydrolase [Patescibacteria group bacterium]